VGGPGSGLRPARALGENGRLRHDVAHAPQGGEDDSALRGFAVLDPGSPSTPPRSVPGVRERLLEGTAILIGAGFPLRSAPIGQRRSRRPEHVAIILDDDMSEVDPDPEA
jgi:hypothetical protein